MIKIKNIAWISLTFLLLLLICSLVLAFSRAGLGMDSYYYHGVGRLMAEGKVPFVDFYLSYTPLSFYMLSLVISVFGTSYKVGLALLYLVYFFDAFMVYRICKQYTSSSLTAFWCLVLTLLLLINSGGYAYELEAFVLLFGLPAVYFITKKTTQYTILSGVFCFCAFWVKQYGLGFIFLTLIYLLFDGGIRKWNIRRILFLFFGFCGALLFFLFLFLLQGIELSNLRSFSGESYEREGIEGLIMGSRLLLMTIPTLVVSVFIMIYKYKDSCKIPMMYLAIAGIIGFMLPCYVRFYGHYMMLAMPFCTILLVLPLRLVKSGLYKKFYMYILAFTLVIPTYFSVINISNLLNTNGRMEQIEAAKEVSKWVPKGTNNVYVASTLLPMALINEYNPPALKSYGMSNGFVTRPHQVLEMLQGASYCIMSDDAFKRKERYNKDVISYLNHNFIELDSFKTINKEICFVYKKK